MIGAELLLRLSREQRGLVDLPQVMLQSGLDSDGLFLPVYRLPGRVQAGPAFICKARRKASFILAEFTGPRPHALSLTWHRLERETS